MHYIDMDPNGVDVGVGKTAYGPTFRFYFNVSSKDCKKYVIVQLSKLKHGKLDKDGKTWNDQSDSHDWQVDGAASATDPASTCTRHEPKLGAGKNIFKDTPGTPGNRPARTRMPRVVWGGAVRSRPLPDWTSAR